MRTWPKVTVVVCGSADEPAVGHTRASLGASDYQGELEILTGPPGDDSSPAAVANRLGLEASSGYLLVLAAGTTLDPRCLRRLVARAGKEDEPVIVSADRRGADGRPIAGQGFFSVAREVIDLLPEDRLPHDLTGVPTMLIRTTAFNAAGGFDLGLATSPALAADLAIRMIGPGGHIGRATGAVALEPGIRSGLERTPAYRLASPSAISPDALESKHRRPQTILWVAPHLPNPSRSGVDARHIQMMRALRSPGTELVVFSAHGTHEAGTERRLDALGIHRITPPPDERWEPNLGRDHRFEDVFGARPWDTILVSHSHMAPGIMPIIRRAAGDARTIVDMGSVRFPAAHTPTSPQPDVNDPWVVQEIATLSGADAVVTATIQDRHIIELAEPTIPAFVWSALGEDPGPGGTLDGSLLYVGDLFHHPNAQGIEWWLDAVAARVEARMGRPVPLRAVGTGSEIYRTIWRHPHKIELAGWQPDLGRELAAARVLTIPLTYTTGTGGRMATALAAGLPVAASAPAAALLPDRLAGLVHVGSSPAELAGAIAGLLTDDARWEDARAALLETDIPALRVAQSNRLVDWLASIESRDGPGRSAAASQMSGSRRGLRRLVRAS
ncbi:MAG: glycosyltransferase [Acidimicrobiia bacterium]|nr:glycosyltransferase [Acidimicrobiia bacterium]